MAREQARGRLPRRARPGGGQPGSPLRRPGPGRGRHRRGAGGRRRALARRGRAAQPGRLADHGGGQQGARPDPPREAAPGQVRGGVPHGHRRRPRRADRPGRGRPAAAAVHLLPPRPRAGEPRGSHPEAARRADRGRDRRRLLRPRDDDGAADHPLEAEDQGRQHPLPDPAGRRRAGADEWRPRRPLPGLQRGLPRVLGRGTAHRPDHRGDPAHPAAARDARSHPVAGPPAGGRRAPGADAAGGLTQRGPGARRRTGRPRRAGPHAVGRHDDRRGPPARTALPGR